MEANFRETAKLVTGDEQLASLRAMEQWSREEFAARRLDFTQRKRNGMVRECHGDMHLANIVLLNETPVLFDRIEFNEDFRWIDVMNELAFPVMDLVHRGPRELARRLLNAYVEETGDYAGLTVLPYYVTYRAVVRAKVMGIRAQQKDCDAQERQRLCSRLSNYLNLARQYTRPPQPLLLVTHGVAGSGKTSGTQALIENRRAIRVRSDLERKRLLGLGATGGGVTRRSAKGSIPRKPTSGRMPGCQSWQRRSSVPGSPLSSMRHFSGVPSETLFAAWQRG